LAGFELKIPAIVSLQAFFCSLRMMQELPAVAGKSSPVKKSIAQLASASPVRQRDCAPQIQTGYLPVWLGLKHSFAGG